MIAIDNMLATVSRMRLYGNEPELIACGIQEALAESISVEWPNWRGVCGDAG